MRVGRERRVGTGALGENLAGGVERDDLDVGLAEVENRTQPFIVFIQMKDLGERREAGLPSGFAAMMSFMKAHQRCITG